LFELPDRDIAREAVGLMVQLEAHVFKQKHRALRRLVSSSLRFRMGGHRKMMAIVRLRVVSPRPQPVVGIQKSIAI
jgi:hypothetical protein